VTDQQRETSLCRICGRPTEGQPWPLCYACSHHPGSAEEYWTAKAVMEGLPEQPAPPSPSYEPLTYVIDGHTVNILDGCDCRSFFDGRSCPHYEAATERHRSATERR
jgi:hypothetical protein